MSESRPIRDLSSLSKTSDRRPCPLGPRDISFGAFCDDNGIAGRWHHVTDRLCL